MILQSLRSGPSPLALPTVLKGTLGRDIENHIQSSLGNLNFSIFKGSISIRDFILNCKDLILQIEALKRDLKNVIPESHHSFIEGGISEIHRKLNDYRMEYLANRINRNNAEKDEVIHQVYQELNEKISKLNETSFLKQEIERLENIIKTEKDEKTKEKIESQIVKMRNLQQAEFKSTLNDIYNIGLGVSALVGLEDIKSAELIMGTTSSALQIANSIFAINSGITGTAVFGHYGLMASASVQFLSSWGVLGRKQKNGLDNALKAISKQIEMFQERVDERFNRVENTLFKNHRQILQHFAQIHSAVGSIDTSVKQTYDAIIKLDEKIRGKFLSDDLKQAQTYLDGLLEVSPHCLKQNLNQNVALSCIHNFETIIKENLDRLELTKVGGYSSWHRYIDFQINEYAIELGHKKDLPNLAVLNEIDSILNQIDKLNPQLNLKGKNRFKNTKRLIEYKRNEIKKMVRQDVINQSIETIDYEINSIRSGVNLSLKNELQNLSFGTYLKDLEIFHKTLSDAIIERRFELDSYRDRSGIEGSIYLSGLKKTISALEADKKKISDFLSLVSKQSWTNLIHRKDLDFPIIVRPKDEATNHKIRPFLMASSQLMKMHPSLNMPAFTLASVMNYEYDVAFGRDPKYLAGITLSGHLTEGEFSNTLLVEIHDNNRTCARGLRRTGLFRKTPDPFAMSVISKEGHYQNYLLNESCSSALMGYANGERASWNLVNVLGDQKNFTNVFQDKVTKHILKKALGQAHLAGRSEALEQNLAKLKGLLYFKYQADLSRTPELLNQFSSIISEKIYDHIQGQLEYMIVTGEGEVLMDVSEAIAGWYR